MGVRLLMPTTIALHLDAFGQDFMKATESAAARTAVVRTALLYYLSDREAGRASWRVPPFLASGRRGAAEVRVRLDDETVEALEAEGERQGVSADLVAEHALMYFLADLDSGRVSDRLGEALDDER